MKQILLSRKKGGFVDASETIALVAGLFIVMSGTFLCCAPVSTFLISTK